MFETQKFGNKTNSGEIEYNNIILLIEIKNQQQTKAER